ncbi:type II toxin-antitoxin system RelE/ParE family toxin [Stakelama tenebrarum]|uniref:Toxin n=1 Tax=Stakelama tenebrarum TaxID=2711215 RepID=A0A6G6Y3R9_9SPHN|nr:type II toxin-antitoxin system RelE/ParE family toxin [Sphingosinithalassobacter tenebrarum]QIG79457.1 type II toxin-antitoxin system RelE/ParE family toxin [Sphingosinithalassobacter tenebrarum]
MSGYRLSKAAADDLARIAEYTVETFGPAQALAYRDSLISTFEFLAENPRAARLRNELTPPVRMHPHKPHLIIYSVEDDAILIVRIRHGREDWISEASDE